jgi:hypothetical protein
MDITEIYNREYKSFMGQRDSRKIIIEKCEKEIIDIVY